MQIVYLGGASRKTSGRTGKWAREGKKPTKGTHHWGQMEHGSSGQLWETVWGIPERYPSPGRWGGSWGIYPPSPSITGWGLLPGALTLQAINSLALCSACHAQSYRQNESPWAEGHQSSQQGINCSCSSPLKVSFIYISFSVLFFALYLLKKCVICPLEFLHCRFGGLHSHGVI